MRCAHPRKGYIPINGCVNAVRPPSMHEKFSIGRVDVDAETRAADSEYYNAEAAAPYFGEENTWMLERDDDANAMQKVWSTYYKDLEVLTSTLHRIFAAALHLPADFFVARSKRHVTNLAALRYPPVMNPDADVASPSTVPTSSLRVNPHTDPTDLTLIAFEHASPCGLQVWPDGVDDWMDVPPPTAQGALLCNVGDLLRFWTNESWASTRHRVVCRGDNAHHDAVDRLSLVWFHVPDYTTVVDARDVVKADNVTYVYPPCVVADRTHFSQQHRDLIGLPDRQMLGAHGKRGEA